VNLTLEQAVERLAYWQGVLRLLDWKIQVQILPRYLIGDRVGATEWNDLRDARISLLHWEELNPSALENTDMEITLVHELLHLRFRDSVKGLIPDDSLHHDALEAAIEAVAQALVEMDRERGKLYEQTREFETDWLDRARDPDFQ